MKKIILCLSAMFFAGLGISQTAELKDKRFIEVTGTSETEVVPDELHISITLLERMENKEKISIDKQEAELKKHLKELGIDLAQLSLNTADADFRKIKTFKKDVLVSKSYFLKVSSAEMLGKVYERLDQMNAHDAYIARYTHSKILDLQKENRIKALQAAKAKVEYLLAGIGQQAGQPLSIAETENYVQEGPDRPYRKPYMNSVQTYSNDRYLSESEEEISFKKIKMRSAFMVKYEILSK